MVPGQGGKLPIQKLSTKKRGWGRNERWRGIQERMVQRQEPRGSLKKIPMLLPNIQISRNIRERGGGSEMKSPKTYLKAREFGGSGKCVVGRGTSFAKKKVILVTTKP